VRVFIRFKSKRATMYATQEKDEKWGKRWTKSPNESVLPATSCGVIREGSWCPDWRQEMNCSRDATAGTK
jgi:hypothetical protein